MKGKLLFVLFSENGDIEDASTQDLPNYLTSLQITFDEGSGNDSKLAIQRKAKKKSVEVEVNS